MRNYLKLICNYRNGKTFHSLTFYVKLCWKSGGWGGVGLNVALIRLTPIYFLFSKRYMTVHEMKTKLQDFQCQNF